MIEFCFFVYASVWSDVIPVFFQDDDDEDNNNNYITKYKE